MLLFGWESWLNPQFEQQDFSSNAVAESLVYMNGPRRDRSQALKSEVDVKNANNNLRRF